MTHLKLTPAEEKRLADAFVAQALAMGLKGNRTLPKAVKQQVKGCFAPFRTNVKPGGRRKCVGRNTRRRKPPSPGSRCAAGEGYLP
ncbi:Uncharacterised protein [Klebsiella pneumoniae]|uniref:Uncharacterized protein n=1 Tax=Klebsiella pneumoniae TaxID=573 RepID=A0A377Z4F4_KLEPN|nr:hypothetical protein DR88_5295 [Klebsiella pneumoniae]KXS06105.1 hypothetical protein AUC58_18975 [Acinetobacter baumannii]SQC62266.1 Uncharacterised protein [Klebsiella pneumoniae subsp. pneumoniae]KHF64494.1 hypothetical protein LV59_04020 [Klebsiella pneumoniae]SQC62284.1 Uncharacterised protein [Klebsiella pneumoniae subsp. pneumoniae]